MMNLSFKKKRLEKKVESVTLIHSDPTPYSHRIIFFAVLKLLACIRMPLE